MERRPMDPEHDDPRAPAPPSRSARKRAHRSLQALGDALLRATRGELERIPLPAGVREAVEAGRAMRKGARARQVRHLGNLLEREDAAPIREALESLRSESARDAARLRRLERWRERLLAEGDGAMGELAERHPHLDRQRVRSLVRAARDEHARGLPPRRFRELLRYLRSLEEEAG
jgi:ribosome-associated protein